MFDRLRIRHLYDIYGGIAQVEYQRLLDDKENLIAYNSAAFRYDRRMKIYNELDQLPAGSVIWDGGCGSGKAISDLQHSRKYSRLRFMGIDYLAGYMLTRDELGIEKPRIPVLAGLIEDLNGAVRNAANSVQRYPPDLIVFSNSLYQSMGRKTLDLVFKGAYEVLVPGGIVLVYDEGGLKVPDSETGVYERIIQICNAKNLPFQIDVLRGDGTYCDHYLRLKK